VLIPFLPNSVTMLATAGILLALTAVYFAVWNRSKATVAPLTAAVLLTLAPGSLGVSRELNWHAPNSEQLYRANSNFGLLQVIKDVPSGHLLYLNDNLTQNGYDPERRQSIHLFTYMLHGLARCYTAETKDVLAIGLGVGIAPMQFAREGANVDVVEINPDVLPLAEQFFDLEPAKLNITLGDGRAFLHDCQNRYDVVLLDAFLGDSSPSHLMTREAFEAIRAVLHPDGVLVINSFGDLTRGKDFFTASLSKTLAAVFQREDPHRHDGQRVLRGVGAGGTGVPARAGLGRGASDAAFRRATNLRIHRADQRGERHRPDRRLQPGRVPRRRQPRTHPPRPGAAVPGRLSAAPGIAGFASQMPRCS
jgi:spermidine synthase